MARYYSEADYCAEEMARPYAGHCHGEPGERYVVRKEYEEIDEVERARRGHHHGQSATSATATAAAVTLAPAAATPTVPVATLAIAAATVGTLGHSGSVHGLREQHHHGHGYGGSHCDPCETKYDSCSGEHYG